MASDSQLAQNLRAFGDKIAEQPWFQELRSKWDDLDPKSRLYLIIASATTAVILFFVFVGQAVWGVHKLERDLREKTDLLTQIQSANDRLRGMRDSAEGTLGGGDDAGAPWNTFFESTAASAGIDKSALVVGPETKAPAKDGDTGNKGGAKTAKERGSSATAKPAGSAQESLFSIELKHVNLRQVVRYAFQLENGTRPVKLRHLVVDTKSDPSGYLDAVMNVSAFSLANSQ